MRHALWIFFLFLSALAWGQDVSYAKWDAKLDPADARVGESARILIHVKVAPKWHIYGLKQPSGPISTSFKLEEQSLKVDGDPVAPKGVKKYDANFEKELETYEGEAVFALPVKLVGLAKDPDKLTITYQACTEGTCDIPKDVVLNISILDGAGEARPDHLSVMTAVPEQPAGYVKGTEASIDAGTKAGSDDFTNSFQKAKDSGLLPFIWISFTLGLAALLTPCVFPMVPITVSFFSKTVEGKRKTNYSGAAAYCLGIIGTFTALGLIVTLVFGASGIQQLATNAWVNLALVAIFVILALGLFGLFEFAIPSSILTKLGGASRAGGLVGPLLMGLTFTLTSFTCTVPIVGTILAGAASGESLLYPIVGMLAFSTAFALPFFFLALFPQAISKLPKSGSWMSSVKVFMGFLELGAALKFLSNVDLVWQLAWLTKPIFLAVWATLAFVAGFQLMGWLKLPKEGEGPIGWLRRVVAVGMIAGGVFCLAAIEGTKLGELEAFLPPDPYPGRHGAMVKGSVVWKDSADEGFKLAKNENKLVFINFTGVTCTNCRWMEKNMFTRPEVASEINKYVAVELYTDRSTPGDLDNRSLQRKLSKVVTLPVYVVATPEGEPIRVFQGSTRDVDQFLGFLRAGSGKLASR